MVAVIPSASVSERIRDVFDELLTITESGFSTEQENVHTITSNIRLSISYHPSQRSEYHCTPQYQHC